MGTGKKYIVSLIAVVFCFFSLGAFAFTETAKKEIRNVILIGWDGADGEDVVKLLTNKELPNLQKLASAGSIVRTEVVTGETTTKPGWAEILTGYNAPSMEIYNNKSYKPIPRGHTIFERLKKIFGYDKIKTVFIGGKINNIGARGAHEICLNCFNRDERTRKQTGYWDRAICKAQTVDRKPLQWVPREGEPFFNSLKDIDFYRVGLGSAEYVGRYALKILRKYRKDAFFCFFHFEEPDEQGHIYGHDSKKYRDAIKILDDYLGRMVDRLKALGIYERTTIFVTSDHGFDVGKDRHRNAPHAFVVSNSTRRMSHGDRKDVTPTILSEFGITQNVVPPLEGRSLFNNNEHTRQQ